MCKNYFKFALLVLAILMVNVSYGQAPPPPPPVAPIDGGILGLIILGVGYAVKKLREK